MITAIDHIDIAVKDLDQAVDTLLKLGFELVRRTTHHLGTAELKLPGPNQPIFDLHPIVPEHGDNFTGVVHIAFTVDDVQKSWQSMKDAGFQFSEKQKPHLAKSTGRVMYNICDPAKLDSSALPGWGLYLQFVGADRLEPV